MLWSEVLRQVATRWAAWGASAGAVGALVGLGLRPLFLSFGVAIATDLPNSGKSITNAAEQLAEQICQHYEIPPEQLILIEHYLPEASAPEEFSLIEFLFSQSRRVNLQWKTISELEAMLRMCQLGVWKLGSILGIYGITKFYLYKTLNVSLIQCVTVRC